MTSRNRQWHASRRRRSKNQYQPKSRPDPPRKDGRPGSVPIAYNEWYGISHHKPTRAALDHIRLTGGAGEGVYE